VTRSKAGDFWLQVIIVLKVVKAIVLIALGVTAFALAKSDLYAKGEYVVSWFGIDQGRRSIVDILTTLIGMTPHRVMWIGAGSLLYACVFAVEGWFLHLRKAWAEWFTVGVTTSLIPFEIYELVHQVTVGKVITLVVNIAIVIYLVVRRLRT
jgi:uncharacterized membrane protein (DUF2068 family)